MTDVFPKMIHVRQRFPAAFRIDISNLLDTEFRAKGIFAKPITGRVAVGVGSRGIANIDSIVIAVIDQLRRAGAQPFIVPAMGSHGGATSKGQIEMLASYGVTAERIGVPVEASMDVKQLGTTPEGVEVYFSAAALTADAIVVINRIKPHTDFQGAIASGLMKMLAIGLGKETGARICHAAASRLGHERVIRSVARVVLNSVPVLCGVAILENQIHETARLVVLLPGEIERREEQLLREASVLMPRLPFDEIDLLIVEEIGKNISGAGMDPNIVGRDVQGYSSSLIPRNEIPPVIHRIFVRDLSSATHGNGIGLGLADFVTSRLLKSLDRKATYINALTALTPQTAKIPIWFDSDREAITQALRSLALDDARSARVVRIQDTLSLGELMVSSALVDSLRKRDDIELLGQSREMHFSDGGNLMPLASEFAEARGDF